MSASHIIKYPAVIVVITVLAMIPRETSPPAKSFIEHGITPDYGRGTESSERNFYSHLHYLKDPEAKSAYHCRLVSVNERGTELKAENKILFSESFDDENLDERGWYDGASIRISEDSYLGTGCIEYEWISGINAVQGSSAKRRLFEPVDDIYVRFYLRLSENWQWSNQPWHPHLLHFLTTENSAHHGPASSHLTLYIEPVNGKLRLAATDMMNQNMPRGLTQGPLRGGYNGKLYDSKESLFHDDQWHCVEAQFRLNSLDLENDRPNSDGIIRGWFDGKLVIEHTDVIFRTTDFPDMKINQWLMAPYFGPGLLDNNQKLWMDELVISTERVGPISRKK